MTRSLAWRPTPADHPARSSPQVEALSPKLGASSAVPDAVDISAGVEILDQGNTNTCAAQAVAQAIRLAAGLGSPLPSRRYLYRCAVGYAHWHRGELVEDAGTMFGDVLSGAWLAGLVPESAWPWDEAHPLADMPPGVLRAGADHEWAPEGGYAPLLDSQAVRRALAAGHPVVFGLLVDEAFLETDGPALVSTLGEPIGGHAMVAVGYSREGLIVANSYGRNWRAGGFATIAWDLIDGNRAVDFWAIDAAPPGWMT